MSLISLLSLAGLIKPIKLIKLIKPINAAAARARYRDTRRLSRRGVSGICTAGSVFWAV